MYIDYKLEGKYVNLRSVIEDDAEFILQIRNNPQISKFLPPLNVTAEQQRQWISKQRSDKDSYYFLLETPEGNQIGTLSVYNIEGKIAETGRYCSIGTPYANIEACVLLYDFIFNILKLDSIHIWVFEENKPVLQINHGLGFEWVDNKTTDNGKAYRVGIMTEESYNRKRDYLLEILQIN